MKKLEEIIATLPSPQKPGLSNANAVWQNSQRQAQIPGKTASQLKQIEARKKSAQIRVAT